ncbi:hypothetical protein MH117_03320 [Paenibacillus sp. ACRRX]|uniref:hypothetical protein n=1 Tax=unclassified Paenibacillus TaxID=185978 RepID=UPI001EF74BDA|nr:MULTISPECIES: hypothetical protein [unclassified Paenibacillus]MCG7406434.1 hypothetical protein [Paenibacillus sp. ACRRX]MDK8179466.1 hypothetical protein [Paenibacillus sp. UMB4589-SE434]
MNEIKLPPSIAGALLWLKAQEVNDIRWLLGGSCSLLLQGVELEQPPRDIDIYADSQQAEQLHKIWQGASIDTPEWDESPIYRSLLSHYSCDHNAVELVGEFSVRTDWCTYQTVINEGLWNHRIREHTDKLMLDLTPLSHELVFNMLRGRLDRVEKIAETINRDPERHVDAMNAVLGQCKPRQAIGSKLTVHVPTLMEFVSNCRALYHK